MTLGKLFKFSKRKFPHLWGGENLVSVYSLNELIQYIKALNTVLAYIISVNLFSKHSMKVSSDDCDATEVCSLTFLFSSNQHVSFCFRAFLVNIYAISLPFWQCSFCFVFLFEAVLLYCHLLNYSYPTQEFNLEVGRPA